VSIYRVIDKLEAYVRDGTVLPLRRRILSEERLLEFIEKMRSTLPEEVGRAKLITRDKDRVLREAQERAEVIVSEASSAQAARIDEHDLVVQARRTAEIVLREAEEKAFKVRAGADAYAAQVLTELDARLGTALGSVRKGIETLASARATPSIAPAPLAEAAAKSKRVAFDAQNDVVSSETSELESVRMH
jgi:hypothetical protein